MKQVKVVAKGKKRRLSLAVFEAVDTLNYGQNIIILKKSWKLKEVPGAYLLRKYLKKEFLVQSMANRKGWLVTRK